jgi:hypothetical protein
MYCTYLQGNNRHTQLKGMHQVIHLLITEDLVPSKVDQSWVKDVQRVTAVAAATSGFTISFITRIRNPYLSAACPRHSWSIVHRLYTQL